MTDSLTTAAEEAIESAEATLSDATESLASAVEDSLSSDETRLGDAASTEGSGAAGDDHVEGADTIGDEAADEVPSTDGDETVTLSAEDAVEETATADAEPEPAAAAAVPPPPPVAPAPERRGGFVPLLLGGVLAAGVGYGAAYMGWLPTPGATSDDSGAIASALEQQSAALSSLQSQVADLASAGSEPAEAPEVDFGPVLDQIAGLSTRIDEATTSLGTIADRVAVLEERPVFTGDVSSDSAAALEAAAQMEAELTAQREAAAARAEELEAEAAAAAAEAEQAAAEAAEAIAAAEAEAAARAAQAEAEVALGEIRIAMETGTPFAEALTTAGRAAEVPAALAAVADAGVPSLEALQDAFPALAREALPIALRETAGDSMGDRFGAFLLGQVGGRSVEPREGDDPDAVLSRVEAAVQSGELSAALAELQALPERAREILAPWVADVEARAAAEEGLAALTSALSGDGN